MPLAESFAAIVGLLGQYRSERSSEKKSELSDFLIWLEKSNHSELKALIEMNAKTSIYIKAILHKDREIFQEQFDRINNAISAFASTLDGFSDLANSINPNYVLSEQAISILKQFDASKSSRMIEIKYMDGRDYQFLDTQGTLVYSDGRFIDDDLNTLMNLGLLRLEYGSKGSKIYLFTRAAASLVKSYDS